MSSSQPALRMAQEHFTQSTSGRGLIEITEHVRDVVARAGIGTGIVQVFTHHTSCSLIISENADPTVCDDLQRFFARLVPDGDDLFRHDAEGPDDMPAHVRSVLTGANVSIPLENSAPALGTWQGVFLWEHRTKPHQRRISVTVLGS